MSPSDRSDKAAIFSSLGMMMMKRLSDQHSSMESAACIALQVGMMMMMTSIVRL
jgi:hypothetical protein